MGLVLRRRQQFTRRALFLGACQATCLGILGSRLYYLQFVLGESYQTKAQDNRIRLELILPERGRFLDCYGKELVENRQNFRLFINPERRNVMRETLQQLSGLLGLSAEKTGNLEKKLKQFYLNPLLVKENMPWEEVAKVEVQLHALPAASIVAGHLRYYPLGEAVYHCLGYMGAVSEQEQQKSSDPMLRQPDYRIGKSGLERVLEPRLQGKAGFRHVEVDARGNRVRYLAKHPDTPGENIRLSIDAGLQELAYNRLGDESGSVVLMDVETGELLVCVSAPSPDPNRFSTGITNRYWKELSDNPKNPLLNKVIQGMYPPGSTFKMLVGMAALEQGVITPETRHYCPGYYMLGRHRFNCWKRKGHGTVNFQASLEQSCDVFFYTVARQIGMDVVAGIAKRFGLNSRTGIELEHEKRGIIPDAAWKQQRYKQRWNPGDTVNASIGQGYVLATPLQLAAMTAQLVNGGFPVSPTLIMQPGPFVQEGISHTAPEVLDQALLGMYRVVNRVRGTAYGSRLRGDAAKIGKMAGKTGTSQVRRIRIAGQDQSELPWKFRHHALFVGYAPVDKPRYAVSVVVEHGGGGSAAAAPVARDVMEAALIAMQNKRGEDA